jgi:dephospho-CoA kinase
MKIAITGGIGSGKSTMMGQLRHAFPQAVFVSMDAFVDSLYADQAWLDWLDERFNTHDRKDISKLAFENPAVLAQLNAQSALKIGVQLGRILERPGLTFVEFPLLFESGLSDEFNHSILVTASRDVRIQRVVARGRKNAQQAAQVLDSQMQENRKALMASAMIDTSKPNSQDECSKALVAIVHSFLGDLP